MVSAVGRKKTTEKNNGEKNKRESKNGGREKKCEESKK